MLSVFQDFFCTGITINILILKREQKSVEIQYPPQYTYTHSGRKIN